MAFGENVETDSRERGGGCERKRLGKVKEKLKIKEYNIDNLKIKVRKFVDL
jgi:hypothetical protein